MRRAGAAIAAMFFLLAVSACAGTMQGPAEGTSHAESGGGGNSAGGASSGGHGGY